MKLIPIWKSIFENKLPLERKKIEGKRVNIKEESADEIESSEPVGNPGMVPRPKDCTKVMIPKPVKVICGTKDLLGHILDFETPSYDLQQQSLVQTLCQEQIGKMLTKR